MILESEHKIKSLGLLPFEPLPFVKTGISQTVASVLWPYAPDSKPHSVHQIGLEDGDRLSIVEDRPHSWKQGDRIALLVHGLVGHHKSNYMVRIAQKLVRNGVLVLRVNLRGCGTGFGLARHPYHSGRSEDLRAVLRWAAKRFPKSPVTQVGFSLGANITLKLAGEDGKAPTGNLDSIVAVSPPIDLAATAKHLKKSQHALFDRFFVWKLRYDIWRLHRKFPELPSIAFPLRMALTDIDEFYTAPRCGFKDAQDYYAKSSSGPLIPSIRVKGLILCAQDDPIVHTESYSNVRFPANTDLVMTRSGGHVGFIGRTGQGNDVQWMDCLVSQWILKL